MRLVELKRQKINALCRDLAERLVLTTDQPQALVSEALGRLFATLQQEDWETWIADIQVFQQESQAQICDGCFHTYLPSTTYEEMKAASGLTKFYTRYCDACIAQLEQAPMLCHRCRVFFPNNTLKWLSGLQYCPTCYPQAFEENKRTCLACEGRYDPTSGSLQFCPACNSPVTRKELTRIRAHLKRTKQLDLVSTLSLSQWLRTLRYFDWKCAYCLGPFSSMEHYYPVSSVQGGTTQENCFPTCKRCNSRKSDKLPEHFVALFPAANIQRIEEYRASLLAKQTQQTNAKANIAVEKRTSL
jgi:5-methylcytosine-specific restriction endonuclease McrA